MSAKRSDKREVNVYIKVVLYSATTHNNLDDGLDFDEKGEGNISITTTGNTDDGFKVTEEDNGDLNSLITSVKSHKNSGKKSGLKIKGKGVITLKNSEIEDGFKSEKAEIAKI